jgi:chromosome segregation protein
MEIRVDAARKLVESLASIRAEDLSKMKIKLANLNEMKQNLETIKTKALDVLKKERLKQLEALRNRFEESFRRIYPYGRFKSVTFDLAEIRGREALTVKANLDGGWLKASQMSTGENVAISFALLHAINHLEKSPIILLDEPEEGLDPKGVEGLAHVLRRLRPTTQIIVATRDSRFAELLTIPTENQ